MPKTTSLEIPGLDNAKNDVVRNSWARFPPFVSNDVVFGIFGAENAKNDVVRNSWARFPPSFLTTSFLAFSGLKMPKTTSLEIPGLDSPLRF